MLVCPNCQSEISDADFNVSTDLAYCRQCRSNLKYSELRAAITGADLATLIRPRHVKVNDLGDRTEITYRRISPAVWFLIPFTCLWSGMSIGLGLIMPILNNKFDPKEGAFMTPFLFGTVILIGFILFLLLVKLRIILDGDESEITYGVGPLVWRRMFSASNLSLVTIRASSLEINEVKQPEICLILKEGESIPFGKLMKDDSRQYIANLIASKLANY